ncbi:hypothetical protein AUEXF2481DRAFT_31202 [Aureobasidium subglaciale EXF-2481]|uniref:Cryptic loci regulator 2 N-terminal domain-containing protein n=1 Tax=Aureobasidium subglaciale (strain EXF-2481) TaxID=1043005 RepID=A0A074Y7J0_AURSE|nr:uncharacterized protein AUEXF2481DRAFT_31202 [Aureobasidium subglaciale EXF-2481]KAI5212853.1 hypothetical protein E4T38_00058 [Aureobasidium subglaciale]KAI5232439.1 hypothetical protein E4T40_00058 [Aureobasidium subglaciale]KAI5234654.1 hypothetical protein E4T41_00058 [Aureobasidium subglaciale]KAI5268500.1 hypothetical protein E4T46_00058 [Aureobasidium subglaciale]KEQ93635.1 hypothetical protein AUEXF2481DRAFT_31202 [Aureobasidium subglaciale EXF-2481]
MSTIKVDLSAPIYPSDGTGIVPNKPNERVEPDDEILRALSHALNRKMREAAKAGIIALRDELGTAEYDFVGNLPSGYTYVRRGRAAPDTRRDIRIYGHPSGGFFESGAKFMPHVVAMMMLYPSYCCCKLCEQMRAIDARA